MYGLFNGLEIGKRGLITSQLAMNTIGHNMANVNTPGFSRQRIEIISGEPIDTPWGNAGSGVKVAGIEQIRDYFLSDQFRKENASLGNWSYAEKTLAQIEGFFNEPQDSSLGDVLDNFWAAWSTLAGKADDPLARSSLLEQANVLINSFHQLDRQLSELRQSVDNDIHDRVEELNQLGKQIANLNLQISYQELGSEKANDLRAQRDLLVDKLSQYADVRVLERANGTTAVLIGSMAFVDGSDYLPIGTKVDYNDNATTTTIVWANTDVEIRFRNGEIMGMIETRDELIGSYMDALDELAGGIVENINAIHRLGYGLDEVTGRDFFDPNFTSARFISLDVEVAGDGDRIAAGTIPGATADGSNAEAISIMLNQNRLMDGNAATIREFYSRIVGRLGIESMESQNYKDNYTLLVQQIENQRQSVQGVSLDEEMTQMVKFQHAYDAAARVITTIDQALDTLINDMGVVGR